MAVVMRYSEAFKIQVVEDLARGRFGSPFEAAQAHGIGRNTVLPQVLPSLRAEGEAISSMLMRSPRALHSSR